METQIAALGWASLAWSEFQYIYIFQWLIIPRTRGDLYIGPFIKKKSGVL
jgi:hypothetical protein